MRCRYSITGECERNRPMDLGHQLGFSLRPRLGPAMIVVRTGNVDTLQCRRTNVWSRGRDIRLQTRRHAKSYQLLNNLTKI